MASFKCEAGKVLSTSEVEQMLAYDEAKQARPDQYNDVVLDATTAQGTVYRCKTAEEQKGASEAVKEAAVTAERREKLRLGVLKEAGIDEATGAFTGVRSVITPGDTGEAGAAGGVDDTDTGNAAGAGTRTAGAGAGTRRNS
jgi:hypothetical protein